MNKKEFLERLRELTIDGDLPDEYLHIDWKSFKILLNHFLKGYRKKRG